MLHKKERRFNTRIHTACIHRLALRHVKFQTWSSPESIPPPHQYVQDVAADDIE